MRWLFIICLGLISCTAKTPPYSVRMRYNAITSLSIDSVGLKYQPIGEADSVSGTIQVTYDSIVFVTDAGYRESLYIQGFTGERTISKFLCLSHDGEEVFIIVRENEACSDYALDMISGNSGLSFNIDTIN